MLSHNDSRKGKMNVTGKDSSRVEQIKEVEHGRDRERDRRNVEGESVRRNRDRINQWLLPLSIVPWRGMMREKERRREVEQREASKTDLVFMKQIATDNRTTPHTTSRPLISDKLHLLKSRCHLNYQLLIN